MIRVGSMFSGGGGLDLAVEYAFDGRVAWQAEIDPAPSKVLAARFPGVPNLGDVELVDWDTVEPVDVLCAGFPCQDVSVAGRRAGMRLGTRSGLWAEVARAIHHLRPSWVVIENVRGLLSARAGDPNETTDSDLEPGPWDLGEPDGADRPVLRALGAVLGDLALLGYDAEWCGLPASDAGAPHGRFRIFIVARPSQDTGRGGSGGRPEEPGQAGSDDAAVGSDPRGAGAREVAPHTGRGAIDAGRPGRPGDASEPWSNGRTAGRHQVPADAYGRGRGADFTPVQPGKPDSAGRSVPDAVGVDRERRGRSGTVAGEARSARGEGESDALGDAVDDRGATAIDWAEYGPAVRRWEHRLRPVPVPTEPSGRNGKPLMSARFVEWMMGWPEGWVSDVLPRNPALKVLGNGVVPQQAVLAIQHLIPRFDE